MARRQGAVAFPLLAAVLLGACLPAPAAAGVLLSTLPKALAVTASPKPGQGVCPCYPHPRRTGRSALLHFFPLPFTCSSLLLALTLINSWHPTLSVQLT